MWCDTVAQEICCDDAFRATSLILNEATISELDVGWYELTRYSFPHEIRKEPVFFVCHSL